MKSWEMYLKQTTFSWISTSFDTLFRCLNIIFKSNENF